MSGKLDQSLDQIMQDSKPAGGRRPRPRGRPAPRRAATKAKAAIAAPAGGVQKNSRAAPKSTMTTLTAPSTGDSKIIVSNLPHDVTDTQIKDYFGKTIAPVKRVFLTYGPNGKSTGVATLIFSDPSAGSKAAKQLDGVKVDNRAMKIEVVIGAKHVPEPPAPKSLADRMSKPKNAAKDKPKSAADNKANGAATNGAARGNAARGRGKAGRGGRPKKKTQEELDAEMMDYFGGDAGAANGTAQPAAAANGDAGMVDEVL